MNNNIHKKSTLLLLPLLVLLISITGCGSISIKSKTSLAKLIIEPNLLTNLDSGGIQRPVKIKLYYLKDNAQFLNGRFDDLFDQSESYLGDDIIDIQTYQAIPSKSITLQETLGEEVQYIGVVAAFIDINKSDWKSIIKKPKKCLSCIKRIKKPIWITLEGYKIDISVKSPLKKKH